MQVIYGRETVEMDSEAAGSQGHPCRLKSFMGLPHDAVALVDGIKVGQEHSGATYSTVEFRKERVRRESDGFGLRSSIASCSD